MRTRIRIRGMSCSHCMQAVYTALTPVDGIEHLQLGIGWAEIEHDGRVTLERLREAIAVAGYEVVTEKPIVVKRRLPVL